MNYDPLTPQLLLPPMDIDLSQTADYDPMKAAQSSGPQPPMVDALKGILTELSEGQMQAVQAALDQMGHKVQAKFEALISATNAELGELQRQLEAQREHSFYLEQVIDSQLKMELLGESMPEEMRNQHQAVLATFLKNNATLTAVSTEQRVN
jgi:hypothetical protein